MLEDTIIAVATPPGFGGLGIVRLSGPKALAIAGRIFTSKSKAASKPPFPERRVIFGAVRDPEDGRRLDEAFLTYFKAPRSYTREDVVELNVHGSPAVLESILKMGTRAGARQARPGEFTLRAYLNGRLDILQAEAVNDLIHSVSLTQARISARQLGGSLSRRMSKMRARLIALLSRIEAGLEFPDDGLKTGRTADLKSLDSLEKDVARLVASYETGRALTQGLTLAILGRANVGKSTLFNALLEEDRAIVTPFPGTTRDFLRERLIIDGAVFHLVDMAGLGRTAHPVEKEGIARGRKLARQADGLLFVLDASRPLSREDRRMISEYRGMKALVVLNKIDLRRKTASRDLHPLVDKIPIVEVSALKGRNIEALRQKIGAIFVPSAAKEEEIILQARQKDSLEGILEALRRSRDILAQRQSEEICAEEIRTAVALIGEMTGEVRAEEVLDDIFSRFCVGK